MDTKNTASTPPEPTGQESQESPQNPAAAAEAAALPAAPLHKQIPIIAVVVVAVAVGVFVAKGHAHASAEGEPAATAAAAADPNAISVSDAGRQAVRIETEKVPVEGGARVIQTNGVIHFSPYGTIKVSPRLQGRVRAVFVKVGDRVTAGQPLLTMESVDAANANGAARDADAQLRLTTDTLAVARKQFQIGTPEVTAAQAALDQAHANAAFTRRMLALTQEQEKIGGFTIKPLTDAQSAAAQTETQLAQDEKDLANAQRQRDRTAKLVAIGIAARQDQDAAETTLGKMQDAVSNDQQQVRIARTTLEREQKASQTRLYANQQVRQAETSYQQALLQEQAAGTALRLAKSAILRDLKQAEHDYSVASSDARSAHTALSLYDHPGPDGSVTITAPAGGTVTERDVNPGQIVDQSQATPWQMLTLVDSRTVSVDAQVYEKDMASVRPGERVTVTTDALPGVTAAGRIGYVAPGLDPNTHTLPVKADLENPAGLLKDGMYVRIAIDTGRVSPLRSRPIIPLDAVVHDGDRDYVFLDGGGGRYRRREVTLGEQRGEGRAAIEKGLSGGETIVTHGALYLGSSGPSGD